jgi:hypothetical protein
VAVEHDVRVSAGSDWVIDIGRGGGEEGGRVVAAGPASVVAEPPESRTAPYLAQVLARGPKHDDLHNRSEGAPFNPGKRLRTRRSLVDAGAR